MKDFSTVQFEVFKIIMSSSFIVIRVIGITGHPHIGRICVVWFLLLIEFYMFSSKPKPKIGTLIWTEEE